MTLDPQSMQNGSVFSTFLVRYGAMGVVARFAAEVSFAADAGCDVGAAVVVRSPRGEELGIVIGREPQSDVPEADGPTLLRLATGDDQSRVTSLRSECEAEFIRWQDRIREWRVDVELIDLEKTLDGEKLILYVLNDRGPETTKLALQAAAAGYGVIEVQPVGREGLIQVASGGGGCGSCGHKK
jgi:cell fate regulator YaaT (PSP1 superfamily)